MEFDDTGLPLKHQFTHPNLIVWLSGLFCALFGQFKSIVTKEIPNPITKK